MMKVPASPVTLRSDLYLTKTKMMNNAIKYEESWAKEVFYKNPSSLLLKRLKKMLDWLIILFCFLAIFSAVTTSMSSKIIRSTFFFGVTLFVIAFIFISIGSTLLGVVQILLYTGGTLVLFLFAIILTANWDYKNLGETF